MLCAGLVVLQGLCISFSVQQPRLQREKKGCESCSWLVDYDCFVLKRWFLKREGVWNYCETEFMVI